MEKFVEKLSSYNILNNLLPGVVYCFLMKLICYVDFTSDNIIADIFVYYFLGMIISRVGSILVEPLYKKVKIVSFADYTKYIKAEKEDSQVTILSETNNTYRTMIALCLIVLISILTVSVFDFFNWNKKICIYIVLVLLVILFSVSYSKQTTYVKKRIEKQANNQEEKT